jgi:hypothetical protein
VTLVSFQPMRRAVHHWQARSLTAHQPIASDLHVGLKLTAYGKRGKKCAHILGFDRAAVLAGLFGDAGFLPAHAASGPPLASAKPDLLISRLRQPIHIAADPHVRLEGPTVQLLAEMLAQRRLANLKLSGYLGLGDTRERWASVGTYSAVTLRFQSLN